MFKPVKVQDNRRGVRYGDRSGADRNENRYESRPYSSSREALNYLTDSTKSLLKSGITYLMDSFKQSKKVPPKDDKNETIDLGN